MALCAHISVLLKIGVLVLAGIGMSGQTYAQSCVTTFSVDSSNRLFSSCKFLEQLSANFAWTFEAEKGEISVAFRARPDTASGWVAWGINPGPTPDMTGTQSLIAFRHSNGSMLMLTYNVTAASKGGLLEPSPIDFQVNDMVAEFQNNDIAMFATIKLLDNKTTVNHVWQTGGQVLGLVPQKHAFLPANMQSRGTIDLKTGTAFIGTSLPHHVLKNRHGVLNVVGWGIMFPIGAMIARYLRSFESADPAWFYLHVFCQCSGYILGVAGWATGLTLGSYSKGIVYTEHRNIGITIFVLATIQVFALLLRPKKDHKFRKYWNVYHHSIGYTVIVLSIANIFKGYDILRPEEKWKHAYIGVIACLGGIALILEIMSWIIYFSHKSENSSSNPVNGTSSGGARVPGSKEPDAV